MKTVKLFLLFWVALTSQMLIAQDDLQQKAYDRMYALLQMSYDETGDMISQGTSFDIVRNLVILNDESADQIYCCWSDPGLPDINRSVFKSNQPQVADMWTVLFRAIYQCNYFLSLATSNEATTSLQHAEARFLRAYFYGIALDLWGGVPIYTSPDKTMVLPRSTDADVFDFIVSELNDCLQTLPSPSATVYGKPSQMAARLLLARLYLNAKVYTGTARWTDAKQQAQTIIDAGCYTLCNDYARLFMADNDTNGAQREIAWPLVVNGTDQNNWGNTTFLIASTHNSSMPTNGMNQAWAGQVVRSSLLQKFFPNNNCPSASTATIQRAADDDRCLFYGEGRPYGSAPFDNFTDGFSCVKYTNLCSDGSVITNNGLADTDFPLLRYAEAYLILAEADARLHNGVCTQEGLQALNTLRQRAHATTLNRASLETIADEWSREFYLEGRRRSDLVRFGLYSGNQYDWDGKGSPVHDLLPIPDAELARNPHCSQNPGYEDETKKPESLTIFKPAFANDVIDLYKVQGLWFRWQRPAIFEAGEDVTYGVQLSTDPDYMGNYVTMNVSNTEKLLFSNLTLYEYTGRLGIADGETAKVYARVACHGVASDTVSFSICRNRISLPPHTWYILGSPIGDGGWNNSGNGLGVSCVPLGIVDNNTFRFSGYFSTDGYGFKIVRNLGDWNEQLGSYTGSIEDFAFDSSSSNLQFDKPGNYTLTLHYDGGNNYLRYERLDDDLPIFSSISMIGGFTGWGQDVDMTRVEGVNHSWYTRLTIAETTELKFRADHDWVYNWGATDFPYGQAFPNGSNIEVKPGDYMVFFNDITGDYLFLNGRTGTIASSNDTELVDNMYLNTAFTMIDAMSNVTFQTESTESTVQVVDVMGQSVEVLQLLLGDYRLLVDADGKVYKEQLASIMNWISNKQVITDVANNKRTTTVQAVLRGYCNKNDVQVYTESAPFTISMVEEYHLQLADAYYYIGNNNGWNIDDRSIPLVKKQEGVFALTFTQRAGEDHWFKVFPSTTTDWNGDFVYPVNNAAGIGTGIFMADGNGDAWHIPSSGTNKTYTLILDFITMTYTLGAFDVNSDGEVNAADITAIISVMGRGNDHSTTQADVNGDGVVNVADILTILRAFVTK